MKKSGPQYPGLPYKFEFHAKWLFFANISKKSCYYSNMTIVNYSYKQLAREKTT